MMPPVIVLIIYVLAVTRVTTLVTHDEITRPAREALIRWFDPLRRWQRLLVYLLGEPDGNAAGCPWCMSIWVGALTAPVVWWFGQSPWVLVPVLALAASQITGMIYGVGRQ